MTHVISVPKNVLHGTAFMIIFNLLGFNFRFLDPNQRFLTSLTMGTTGLTHVA